MVKSLGEEEGFLVTYDEGILGSGKGEANA